MELNINLTNAILLFASMAFLAFIPSVSVLAVTARTASAGFKHGALLAGGIVLGDIIFIFTAVFGLALLVDTLGSLFYLVNITASAYLLWLALYIYRAKPNSTGQQAFTKTSAWSSFNTGFLITLGDQKAVLFYLAFFPAFFDVTTLSAFDITLIICITIIAVGGVKLFYAWAAEYASKWMSNEFSTHLNKTAAVLLMAAAIIIIVRIFQ